MLPSGAPSGEGIPGVILLNFRCSAINLKRRFPSNFGIIPDTHASCLLDIGFPKMWSPYVCSFRVLYR